MEQGVSSSETLGFLAKEFPKAHAEPGSFRFGLGKFSPGFHALLETIADPLRDKAHEYQQQTRGTMGFWRVR